VVTFAIVADDANLAAMAFGLEVTVIGREPAIEYVHDFGGAIPEKEPPRLFLAAISTVAFHLQSEGAGVAHLALPGAPPATSRPEPDRI
jgi:hypothetical protein